MWFPEAVPVCRGGFAGGFTRAPTRWTTRGAAPGQQRADHVGPVAGFSRRNPCPGICFPRNRELELHDPLLAPISLPNCQSTLATGTPLPGLVTLHVFPS